MKRYARRKPRRKRSRKAYRRKRKTKSRSSAPRSVIATMPRRKLVSFKYVHRANLLTADVPGVIAWGNAIRLNSLFDPEYAVGGHQPMGFDQWQAFYNAYKVTHCRVKITFAATSGGSGSVVIAAMPEITDGTLANSITPLLENRKGTKIIAMGSNNASSGIRIYNRLFNIRSIFGVTAAQYASSIFAADWTADPQVQGTALLWIGASPDSAAAVNYHFSMELTYYAQCFNPKHIAQS